MYFVSILCDVSVMSHGVIGCLSPSFRQNVCVPSSKVQQRLDFLVIEDGKNTLLDVAGKTFGPV
jgi:hypothetical protein